MLPLAEKQLSTTHIIGNTKMIDTSNTTEYVSKTFVVFLSLTLDFFSHLNVSSLLYADERT